MSPLFRRLVQFVAIIAGITVTCLVTNADEIRPAEGSIVLAKAGSAPEYVWNASTYVGHLVTDNQLGDTGLHNLEATAITALSEKVKRAASKSKSVAIRVVYARTGAVSPAYRTATFEGMETVCAISVSRIELEKHAADWADQLGRGSIPPGVKIEVLGKLPPQ